MDRKAFCKEDSLHSLPIFFCNWLIFHGLIRWIEDGFLIIQIIWMGRPPLLSDILIVPPSLHAIPLHPENVFCVLGGSQFIALQSFSRLNPRSATGGVIVKSLMYRSCFHLQKNFKNCNLVQLELVLVYVAKAGLGDWDFGDSPIGTESELMCKILEETINPIWFLSEC